MDNQTKSIEVSSGGLGIGSVIAAILSWTTNHSVLWCILHTLLGWLYVVFWLFVHKL